MNAMNSREKQFQGLFEKHADEIFRFIYFRVYDREVSKDLVQETFLRVWQVQIKQRVWNERALLFKIARNLIIDRTRQKKESYSLDKMVEEGGAEPLDKKDLAIDVDGKLFLEKIGQLPETEKELIALRYINEFSPREIAKMLNRSVGVVSVQLTRAKAKLKKIYEDSL